MATTKDKGKNTQQAEEEKNVEPVSLSPVVYNIELEFDKGYIADPYWPEREELINIQKSSGMNRAKSEKTRNDALTTYLNRLEMSMEEYEELTALAQRPWYRRHFQEGEEIMIIAHQMYGCLIESVKHCPAALRLCEAQNLRHMIYVSDFSTGKDKEDGIFRRLVMPKDGNGKPLSNQRALRENPYIEHFIAIGRMSFYPYEMRDEGKYFKDYLTYCGQRVGVGASRKMGYGRFTVKSMLRAED